MNSRDLLTLVRTKQNLPSNYALARFLGNEDKTVQRWHTLRNTPDDVMAAKLADYAGLDPLSVIAAMHAQRAANDEERALWEKMAERLSGSASGLAGTAAAAVLSALLLVPADGNAMAHDGDKMPADAPLYIM